MAAEGDEGGKKRKLDQDLWGFGDHDSTKDTFLCFIGLTYGSPGYDILTLDKTLACRVPSFFRKAFQDGSAEATAGEFRFDDTDTFVFREISSYIHEGQIFADYPPPPMPPLARLFDLWISAEQLGMPHLQNLVMDTIARVANNTRVFNFRPYPWESLYRDTGPHSPLRRMIREIASRKMQPSFFIRKAGSYERESGQDLCNLLMDGDKPKKRTRARKLPLDAKSYYVETGSAEGFVAPTSSQPEPLKKRKLE